VEDGLSDSFQSDKSQREGNKGRGGNNEEELQDHAGRGDLAGGQNTKGRGIIELKGRLEKLDRCKEDGKNSGATRI